MAEADPKRGLQHDGSGPPKKKPTITSSTAGDCFSPWKDPNEVADTATSKPQFEEIVEVDYPAIEIMQDILSYRNRKQVCPFENPDDMRRFCSPYILKGVGNKRGWSKKMEEMKNKFNSDSDPTDDDGKKEFELWKQIWGNERKGDDDPGVGSSCK